MKLYSAADLHSNNHFLTVIDEQDKRILEKRLPNDLSVTLKTLEPYRQNITGVAVESTFNWYWLVDGLMEAGYHVMLVNTSKVRQYEGLKYKADGLSALTDIIEYKRNAYGAGMKWNIPTGYVGLQYIHAANGSCQSVGGNCDASDTGANMVGAGYYHTLSKQTQAYIMATWIGNKDLNQYNTAGGTSAVPRLGGNVFGATVGLKHSF